MRVTIVALAASMFASMLAKGITRPDRPSASINGAGRGSFAFHYEPVLTEEALQWYSQFELLITHEPLPREQVQRLHAAGTRLLLYEWATAFYESRATDWQRSLLTTDSDTLLNTNPLTGHAGSSTSAAWYFNPGSREHEFGRASDLARRIRAAGYDGVFLDATTVEGVHPAAKSAYESAYPGVPYDLAYSRFLIQLRKNLPSGILFTNQGYRHAADYLPYVDWDLTESLITRPSAAVEGLYDLRSWQDSTDPWNSIHFLMKTAIEPVVSRYPRVKFAHLNYIHESSAETIQLAVAVAQLFDTHGYVAAPTVDDEIQPIYFRNAGKPASPRVDIDGGRVSYRYFENGIVAVTASDTPITIENRQGRALRDHLSGALICGQTVTLPAAAGVPRAFFFDFDLSSDCGAAITPSPAGR